jgi:hypothetical protein
MAAAGGGGATWAARQAELQQEAITAARVAKLRRLYWFGVGAVVCNGIPAVSLGAYGWARSNEHEGVACVDKDLAITLEPTAVVSNMGSVGFFLVWGALFALLFVYTVIMWFERLQQVGHQPKIKGKIIGATREFGTTGLAAMCYVACASIFCYTMFVLYLLLLSAAVAGASEDCALDEGQGGQMFSAASKTNGMAWLYIFATAGEVVLLVLWLRLRRKKAALADTFNAPLGGLHKRSEDDGSSGDASSRAGNDAAGRDSLEVEDIGLAPASDGDGGGGVGQERVPGQLAIHDAPQGP